MAKKKVELSADGTALVITLPLLPEGKLSKSGKTNIVASTQGFFRAEDCLIEGKEVIVSANAMTMAQ